MHDNPHSRLAVDLKISGVKALALVDCGSTHTLVRSEMIPKLEAKGSKFIPYKCDVSATLADGSRTSILGHIVAPINLMGKSYVCDCQVFKELPQDCVLGLDAMRRLNMSVNFGSNTITVKGNTGIKQVPVAHISSCDIPEAISGTAPLNVTLPSLPEKCDLLPHQEEEFQNLVDEYKEIFKKSPGKTNLVEHKIYLHPGTMPIKQRYYPVSPEVQRVINEEIDKLLADGHIEESSSAWSSPIVVVPKKNGQKRICIDFRKVNNVTQKNAYPAPHINHILNQLKDAKVVSSLDLKKGFHQIPLSKDSKEITAFTVPGRGLYQYRDMPFGITNAPGSFQQLMDTVLRPVKDKGVFIYIDDILVTGRDYDEHKSNLIKVFELLFKAGLAINWESEVS